MFGRRKSCSNYCSVDHFRRDPLPRNQPSPRTGTKGVLFPDTRRDRRLTYVYPTLGRRRTKSPSSLTPGLSTLRVGYRRGPITTLGDYPNVPLFLSLSLSLEPSESYSYVQGLPWERSSEEEGRSGVQDRDPQRHRLGVHGALL